MPYIMDYEIVELKEKILSSLEPVHLSNLDAEISKKIELVWHNFSEKCSEVENKVTNKPISHIQIIKVMKKGNMIFQLDMKLKAIPPFEGWLDKKNHPRRQICKIYN